MSGFRWEDPLWLLAAAPLLAAMLWSLRAEDRAAIVYSSTRLVENLPISWAQRCKRMLPWVRFVGLLLITLSLARPQLGLREFRIQTEGIAIVTCVDRSGSMLALDFTLGNRRVDRLEAVKSVFRDFVEGDDGLPGRPDDQIGLISFGGFAETAVPLTLDHGALLEVLDSIQVAAPIYDRRGQVINARFLDEERATAIGDAVALAVDRLKDAPAKSKVIVLLSDGENTAGIVEPREAADVAKRSGIKIYAIGVGTTGRAPFRLLDPYGRERLVDQPVQLDEQTLRQMAEITGGRYFNASDTQTLENVYAEIDRLEKTRTEGRLFLQYHELFQWLLLPGIALVLVELTLRWTRFRTLP